MKDEIKSRLLSGEKFATPRGSGKTQAIIELLVEHGDRFVAVLSNKNLADSVLRRYQEHCFDHTGVWDTTAGFKIRSIKGSQPFPVGYHDYLADELYMFPVIPFFIYAGVGTPLGDSQVYTWEPKVTVPQLFTSEEEFAWHFEPRP